MLIYQNYWVYLLITLLEHRHHKNAPIVSPNNERGVINGCVHDRVRDLLIREKELKLMLIVDVLNNERVEIYWATLHSRGKQSYIIHEEWDLMFASKLCSII